MYKINQFMERYVTITRKKITKAISNQFYFIIRPNLIYIPFEQLNKITDINIAAALIAILKSEENTLDNTTISSKQTQNIIKFD